MLQHKTLKVQLKQVQTILGKAAAENTRDSLSKLIYKYLFDYLINKINNVLSCDSYARRIGILDIFGFELFETNGFQQFCIKLNKH